MVYLYTYIWLIFIANVGKYTSPMDAIGKFALCSPRHVSRTCEKKNATSENVSPHHYGAPKTWHQSHIRFQQRRAERNVRVRHAARRGGPSTKAGVDLHMKGFS